MKNLFLLIFLILKSAKMTLATARISLTDKNGKHKIMDLPYTLESQKILYGTRYGISLFRLKLESCKLIFPKSIHEYFAAYIIVPSECEVEEIYDELSSHGPNFVFLDLRNMKDQKIQKNISKKVDVPLFLVEDSKIELEFFGDKNNEKVYIQIQFIMVC